MPIYEYQCKACGHYLEVLQKFSDAPIVNCPKCSQQQMQKLISATQFQLKGSGWYVTDFKDKKPKPKATTEENTATTNKDTENKAGAGTE